MCRMPINQFRLLFVRQASARLCSLFQNLIAMKTEFQFIATTKILSKDKSEQLRTQYKVILNDGIPNFLIKCSSIVVKIYFDYLPWLAFVSNFHKPNREVWSQSFMMCQQSRVITLPTYVSECVNWACWYNLDILEFFVFHLLKAC